ncbi:ATP-binding protein [Dactylosporangium sp. AC04546]|uniref:sensor histidine kinase n=1 Tax=Dactylosporangium sp. AC04546 TaxID=2862460 RepID=UPI001EDD1D33|nr:ATP-binding protein [Dactylosporangium sp. AC04546]WVK78819.1 ATP-binding protein [Dactylosporangium sp. AC04546]
MTTTRSWPAVRWRRLPLRVRLIAGFAAAMLVVLTGAGAFVYLRVQYALDRRLDADLATQSAAVTAALHDGTLGPRNPAVVSGGLYQILDPTGAILHASPGLTGRPLLTAGQVAAATRRPVRTDRGTLLPISTEPLRVLATPLSPDAAPPTGQPAIVVVAVRRDQRDEALRELIAQLALANLAALAVASLVGYRLARAALDPVERYRVQAARITAGATGVRLDIPTGDDELTRLGRTLNAMLTALDTALERERRFVSDASHELRTPLTLLAAELELALRRPRPAAELEEALRAAATDTAGLIALADTLLAVGVQPAPGPATPATDLSITLAPIVQRYRNAADLTDTTLSADLDATPPVRIDPARLERIVTNLLDNAVRHGAPPITVTTATTDGYARLTVHDTGPGMPAEFLPHAAERFARADAARTTPGTGLGLSLVDAIVIAHGGQLRWCSGTAHHHPQPTQIPCTHPGTGTTITVLLPAAPANAE